jgi:hypothetical protein
MRRVAVRGPRGGALWRATVVGAILLSASGWAPSAVAATRTQPRFPSPEAAVTALVDAVRAGDKAMMLAILGPGSQPLVSSGDEVADRRSRQRFVDEYTEANRLLTVGEGKVVLSVGADEWPLPIPLVQDAAGWRFDTAAGKREILDRRIGRNELSAIQVCLAYVDAQREYFVRDPDEDRLREYAQHFASAPGKRDGLFWETQPGEPPSPLGPLVAKARGDGYPGRRGGGRVPYWGYYYRILKAQGAHAPGGAYEYVVRGHMIGGFALVAFPAKYRASGVMTFVVNHDGLVYQKDLGPNTGAIARAMAGFDPDGTWKRP